MPFNGSGTFSIINTFVPNTTILSSAVNQNFSDIATGLSDCLTRDGQAGMTAALKLINGSSGAPSLTATSDTATGLYFPATGVLGLVANALGIKVNSEIYAAQSATISNGGSGYAVGDTITETGGTAIVNAVFTVAGVAAGVVTSVTATVPGIYTAKPTNPVSQGSTSGSGTGCTLTITWNNPASSDFRLAITSLADALLWTNLGASSFVSGLMAKANGLDFATGIGSANLLAVTGVSPAPQGSYKNLAIKVATNTTVAVTVDSIVLKNSGTSYFLATSVSATCNLGTTGANALDTGTIATNTWYNLFVIYNGTTTATLASTSATSPTLPSGYTYSARIGAVRTINASATLYGTWQFGNSARYIVGLAQTTAIPNLVNGSAGSVSVPTWVSVSVSSLAPPTATAISISLTNGYNNLTNGRAMAAPNNSYGASNSTNQAPLITTDSSGSSATPMSIFGQLMLESSNIYWASSGSSGAIYCLGWTDSV